MYQPKPLSQIIPVHNNSLTHDQQHDRDMVPSNGGSSPNNPNLASRKRLRWTHELHERFVDAVTQLGGPDMVETLFNKLLNVNTKVLENLDSNLENTWAESVSSMSGSRWVPA
ncbi:Myb family transcription factor APL [Acorus calamus]|uniref:Myb family transcription factor APL n=1 Tax=Acorus calamus TaxID=4465 RepID=A0AAV9F2B1_ACOCL|nr:Myb family transcription factor APL [Acorus calamus]